MEWKSLELGVVKSEVEEVKQEDNKGFYCAADSPVCSNRGKYRKEVRACWDTMKNLKYINGNLTDGNDSYFEILNCTRCGDFYLEECQKDSFVKENEFICFECNMKG
jgi:hypothetical protein